MPASVVTIAAVSTSATGAVSSRISCATTRNATRRIARYALPSGVLSPLLPLQDPMLVKSTISLRLLARLFSVIKLWQSDRRKEVFLHGRDIIIRTNGCSFGNGRPACLLLGMAGSKFKFCLVHDWLCHHVKPSCGNVTCNIITINSFNFRYITPFTAAPMFKWCHVELVRFLNAMRDVVTRTPSACRVFSVPFDFLKMPHVTVNSILFRSLDSTSPSPHTYEPDVNQSALPSRHPASVCPPGYSSKTPCLSI